MRSTLIGKLQFHRPAYDSGKTVALVHIVMRDELVLPHFGAYLAGRLAQVGQVGLNALLNGHQAFPDFVSERR